MPVATYLIGGGAFGITARMYALAIQKRSVWSGKSRIEIDDAILIIGPGAHLATASIFAGIGYWLYGLEERQAELIEERKAVLLESRRKRLGDAAQS